MGGVLTMHDKFECGHNTPLIYDKYKTAVCIYSYFSIWL